MPQDHSLWLRQAAVTALAAASGIQAIVGTRVYGERAPSTPTWPFIRVGLIIALPYEATCLDGMDAGFAVNSFSRQEDAGEMYQLRELVVATLEGAALSGSGKHVVRLDWTDSNNLGGPRNWHDVTQFQAVTAADF